MQPLGNPVHKQVRRLELGEVAGGKPPVGRPPPLGHRRDRRAGQHRRVRRIAKRRLDIARGQHPRLHLDGQALQLLERSLITARICERNASARSATCGAAYSIAPSAFFSRPNRWPLRLPLPDFAPCSQKSRPDALPTASSRASSTITRAAI